MKKQNIPWLILGAAAVALLIYILIKSKDTTRQLTATTDNYWDSKKFVVKTPFGRIQVEGQPNTNGDETILEDEQYLLGRRAYNDRLEVFMVHKRETDPIALGTIIYTYNTQTIFPNTIYANQPG